MTVPPWRTATRRRRPRTLRSLATSGTADELRTLRRHPPTAPPYAVLAQRATLRPRHSPPSALHTRPQGTSTTPSHRTGPGADTECGRLSEHRLDASSYYAPQQRVGRQLRPSRISAIPHPDRARIERLAAEVADDVTSSSESTRLPLFEREAQRQRALDATPRTTSRPITRSHSRATMRRRR